VTVIEKFEATLDVGFVFVLLAPDEVAYLATKAGLDKPSEPLRDVRDRMSSLKSKGLLPLRGVEIATDVSDLFYMRYDESVDEVRYQLVKNLKA